MMTQATQGSIALKSGVLKVSKQKASSFMMRILARCQQFEEMGKSYFAEPYLRNVLFGAPTQGNDAESIKGVGSAARSLQSMTVKTPSGSRMQGLAFYCSCYSDWFFICQFNGSNVS